MIYQFSTHLIFSIMQRYPVHDEVHGPLNIGTVRKNMAYLGKFNLPISQRIKQLSDKNNR